jgi:hypothetical protein
MNAKIIYGTAWYGLTSYIEADLHDPTIYRKKERTSALVVSAVSAGFRAIDTGYS